MFNRALATIAKKSQVPAFNFSNQLSTSSLNAVKNSIPLIQQHGNAIAENFYVQQIQPTNIPFFNRAHFTSGQQAQTLSQFLVLLAQRSDNLELMNTHLRRISNKHVGFGIKPQHYPIFFENLFVAFKEVLGTKATPELISSWKELVSLVQEGL